MGEKSAFTAVIGRPSAGKSTLVNKICGEKVAIISPFPQTTRNAIRGIYNSEQGQLVFIDTPGMHKSDKKINLKLKDVSIRAVREADIILYVIDATRPPGSEEAGIAAFIAPFSQKTVVAVNKTDLCTNKDINCVLAFLANSFPGFEKMQHFAISAKKGEGITALLAALFDMAAEGTPFYDKEYYTDQEISFRITEIIREQAIKRLRQELPHALYVEAADIEFTGNPSAQDPLQRTLWVRAFIAVERDSQKGIVVGEGGVMIKSIRIAALKELRQIFDWKIKLDLRVKTKKDWRHNDNILQKIIGS